MMLAWLLNRVLLERALVTCGWLLLCRMLIVLTLLVMMLAWLVDLVLLGWGLCKILVFVLLLTWIILTLLFEYCLPCAVSVAVWVASVALPVDDENKINQHSLPTTAAGKKRPLADGP